MGRCAACHLDIYRVCIINGCTRILLQRTTPVSKTIIYCADGTWNGAGLHSLTEFEFDKAPRTNVRRIFELLEGVDLPRRSIFDSGLGLHRDEKELRDDDRNLTQVALYCHGVGANRANPVQRIAFGGALGGGVTTRLRLGYTYISSQYQAGDKIVIVGFSRGAYTARALADLIVHEGLLKPELANQHAALSWAAAAWLKYRASYETSLSHGPKLDRTIEKLGEGLHRWILDAIDLRINDDDFVRGIKVAALGVFDTVGSMGLPDIVKGERVDDFEFVSTTLDSNIGLAFSAVSLDEERINFPPTFWDTPDNRLTQMLFAGAHSDVGGGYPDHGLADCTLDWMVGKLRNEVTLRIKPTSEQGDFNSSPLALAHCPWSKDPLRRFARRRAFPDNLFSLSTQVEDRMKGGHVPLEDVESPSVAAYNPALPNLTGSESVN